MRLTACECPRAGWCERHQCGKTEPLFQQCRRNRVIFQAWEDGHGPCLPLPVDGDQMPPSPDMPGLGQRIANFGMAATRHLMSGLHRVSDEVYEARLAICRECPSCELTRMICREKTCGCYLETKARWASEDCPRTLWPAIQKNDSQEEKSDLKSADLGSEV